MDGVIRTIRMPVSDGVLYTGKHDIKGQNYLLSESRDINKM